MASLRDVDVREACITLSRLLDPREAGSVHDVVDEDKAVQPQATGQAVEATMHTVESVATSLERIAAALEEHNSAQYALLTSDERSDVDHFGHAGYKPRDPRRA